MCNSQYAKSCSHVPRSACTPAVSTGSAGADPMADVIRENPTCNYGQAYYDYISTSPNDVPVPVTPRPSMPISVQPAGPGTPLAPAMPMAPPPAMPMAPLYQTAPLYSTMQPAAPAAPSATFTLPPMASQLTDNLPESLTNPAYIPGFLRENIGSLVRVEFLLTDCMTDRVGILREVGASYIILDALDGSSKLLCDLFSIRFVTIMQQLTPDNFQTARTIHASSRFQG